MTGKLNVRQTKFVQEYLISGNATKAAIKAGYSKKTARSLGQRMLTNVDIKKAIAAAQKKTAERHEGLRDQVINELKLIAFSKISDFVEWKTGNVKLVDSSKLTETQRACVSEVSQTVTESGGSIRFKLHSKIDALDKLCRHLGLYAPQKIETKRDLSEMSDEEIDTELDSLQEIFTL